MTRVLLTTAEAADALALSQRVVQELTAEGRIAVVRVGRAVRYRPEALERFAITAEGYDVERGGHDGEAQVGHRVGLPAPRRLLGGRGPGRPRKSQRPGGAPVPLRPVPGGG